MKRVALFGGSFNPPHPGHFEMAKYIYQSLGVDEVWFLFSENWQKDPTKYESAKHRMAMGNILAQQYPNMPFVMSGIQNELGTHITYDVLTELEKRFSDHQFIWVMGADNLKSFESWEHSDRLIQNFVITVVDRPSYTQEALQSPTAIKYDFLRVASPQELTGRKNGWCFLNNPLIDMSSSDLLPRLKKGQTHFDGPFQDVADYIRKNKLYGINPDALDRVEIK